MFARWLGILLVAMLAPVVAGADISLKDLSQMEDVAIWDRLSLMEELQVRRTSTCRHPEAAAFRQAWWNRLGSGEGPRITQSAAETKATVLLQIQRLLDSKKLQKLCQRISKESPIISIRQTFRRPPGLGTLCDGKGSDCGRRLSQWYEDFSPACYQIRQRGELSSIDGNACFAADGMVLNSLARQDMDPLIDGIEWAAALLKASLAEPKAVDIWVVFQSVFPEGTPQQMLALLASFSTSGNSGLTGWLQGIEDRLLIRWLNENMTANDVYERIKLLQTVKITYQKFRTVMDERKLRLRVRGVAIDDWNRHNMMAAFLGCENQMQDQEVTLRLVLLIGQAYEAKDFISHLLEGMHWEPAVRNWREDTDRYRQSGQIGYRLCQSKPVTIIND